VAAVSASTMAIAIFMKNEEGRMKKESEHVAGNSARLIPFSILHSTFFILHSSFFIP
jgi:hypothetical protein